MRFACLVSLTIAACLLTPDAWTQNATETGVDAAPSAGAVETTQAAYTSWKYENPGASYKFSEDAQLAAAQASAMKNAGATLPAQAGQAAYTSWRFENPGAKPMVESTTRPQDLWASDPSIF